MPCRFEFELENEVKQELEEEYPAGLELEGAPESHPFLGLESDGEWEQLPVRCPTPRRETVSGFSRYSNSVVSLPTRRVPAWCGSIRERNLVHGVGSWQTERRTGSGSRPIPQWCC